MKYVHLLIYRSLKFLIHSFSPIADWIDTHFHIDTDRYGTGLGGEVGLRLMRMSGKMYSKCKEDETI